MDLEPPSPARRCPRCGGRGELPGGRWRSLLEDAAVCCLSVLLILGLILAWGLLRYALAWAAVL